MARGDTLKRQWALVQALQSHRYGLTIEELAEKVECTRRTIQRDINVLRDVGLPIQHEVFDTQGQRRYTLPHGYLDRNDLLLTITEALSLYLAKAFMAPLAGTSLGEAFNQLVNRIEQSLSGKTVRHFKDLQSLLLFLPSGQPDYSKSRPIVAAIEAAIRERRVLNITYHSQWRGDDYATDVHPYGLVFWESDFYLVGHSCRASDLRCFKITRISRTQPTTRSFVKPDDFYLADYFSSSISITRGGQPFDALVRFTGPAMNLVAERRWHPSQKITHHTKDHLLVKLRISDAIGLTQWVRSFGPHAELLAPQRLRCQIKEQLAATLQLYKSDEPPQ